jgi:hypothetical protein
MPINPTGRGGSIQLNTSNTTVRTAPRNDFGTHMRTGIATGSQTAAGAIGVAAPFVPGAAVVSAAVSGAGNAVAGGGSYGGGATGMSGSGSQFAGVGDIPTSGPGLGSDTSGAPSEGFSQQKLLDQTKGMQEMMASFNLQYLQLQEKMQGENRSFTTISNVMKTKHDTAKASINNVR